MTECVWCGKKGKPTFHARVVWGKLKSSWYECVHCGSLMILPRPSKKQIQAVYEDDYMHQQLQPHEGVDCRIRYAPGYRSTVYKEYELSLADLGVGTKGVKRILDFGCADGIFLEFAKTHFGKKTELYGTDISEDLLAQAKAAGWQVFPISALPKLGMQFDLITLWDVIEHVPDPYDTLSHLVKFLAPGGTLVMETPRFGRLGKLFGNTWPHLLPVQHLSVASKEGMAALAKRLHLAVVAHTSFGGNAPGTKVAQPYKGVYDRLAKEMDFGDVQLVRLERSVHKPRT